MTKGGTGTGEEVGEKGRRDFLVSRRFAGGSIENRTLSRRAHNRTAERPGGRAKTKEVGVGKEKEVLGGGPASMEKKGSPNVPS